MLSGCPVIATSRSSAVAELLDRCTWGLLVRPGDSQGLAEAMLQLIWDDDARRRLAAGGPDRLARFSADAVATDLQALVSGLVGTVGGRSSAEHAQPEDS